jgi:alcohol dehydrogenase (cytochrome c)
MMRNKTILLAGAGFVLAAALGTVAFGQGAAGPFTAAQATAGHQQFDANCSPCHLQDLSGTNDAPALAGTPFMGAWGKRTTAQLYSKIATTMPAGAPGALSPQQYTDITAYILERNGARTGTTPFTPTTAVQIDSIANGKAQAPARPATTAQLSGGTAAQTSGRQESAPASGEGNAPAQANAAPGSNFARAMAGQRVPDPGSFGLPTKFGVTVKGNIQNYQPVTEQMMVNPPANDWLMYRRNYQGWSFSPLNQINTANAGSLQLKWMWSLEQNGTLEGTPIVHNGVMFVWSPGNTVQALNATTGELIWENRLGPAPRRPGPGPSTEETRSLGLWGNNVYVNTPQGHLYALDARTGEQVWKTHITDELKAPNGGMFGGSTGGIIIIKGRVLVGMTNCGRNGDDNHCYISAYDAATGKRDWKFVTVALSGQKGGGTWGKLPDNMRKGGETWIAGTYDPDLNTTYWGTAQAKPWRRDLRGSGNGATDWANSTIALNPETGQMKWAYNHAPGESLDLDEVFERVLVDHNGQKSLLTIGKPGILWKLDRVTGKFIAAKQTVYQNVYEKFDEKTGQVVYRKDIRDQNVDQWLASCPGPEGGHDWQAMSYHQPSDAVIIPLSQSCVFMLGNGSQTYFEMPGTDGNMGRLSAYRASDLKPLWSFQQRAPFLTSVISTAGNVAFVGDFDRTFRAVDTTNGKTLWKTRLATTVQGYPVTFSVDGKQYVAVTTGLGGGSPQLKPGTMLTEVHRPPHGYALYVFGLPDAK